MANVVKVELGSGKVGICAMEDASGVFLRLRRLESEHAIGSAVHVADKAIENKDGDVLIYFGNLKSTMVLVEQLSMVVARHVSVRDQELRAINGCHQVFQVDKDL
jgi:hypothetical protein